MSTPSTITSPTRKLSQQQVDVLKSLQPGQRIRVVQTVRVGVKQWTTTVEGVFRSVNALATGLATDRVPEDDIVVPTVHFTKENGELSSVALDEQTRVEIVR